MLEMIVAVGVFSVAILISISAFLNLENVEKKIQADVETQNNLRFALEIMSKEIRTGISYHCSLNPGVDPIDCPSGLNSITFKNTSGQTIIYRQSLSRVEKSSDGGVSFQPLTTSNITVESLKFYVVGAPTGDNIQPRTLISLKATGQIGRAQSEFVLQTAVSQRKPAP